jgi:hypothetical protein
MRHVLAMVLVAVVASIVFAPVASAQTKWVRGTVVSVVGDTVVVKAAGKDMTFKVDKNTVLTARGAGTAQRQAEMTGAAGVKLVGFVKPGVGVEVQYTEAGGVMTVTEIHSGITVREGATGDEVTGGSANGTVTAIMGDTITVKGGDKEWKFAIDRKTTVVGVGLGTIDRQFKEQGKSPTITDLLGTNDKVIVYFKELGGAMRASEIRVTAKAAK